MTDDLRSRQDDVEEPPLVLGLLMRAQAGFGSALRRAIVALGRRLQVFLWGAGTLAVFLTILALSIAQSPTLGGIGRGIGVGLLTALIFAVATGWTLVWANSSPKPFNTNDSATAVELDAMLAPTLRELNAVRREVMRQVKARSVTRVPIAAAAAFGVWVLARFGDDPPGGIELVVFLIIGAAAGEMWAAHQLDRDYRRLYKERVLPRLAARLGDLTYRPADAADVYRLQAQRILPEADTLDADDAIVGTHHGLPLTIVEARLKRRSGDDTHTVFDGLLIDVTLPRRLTGTTAVMTDQGVFGNLKVRLQQTGLEPVRLENHDFEKKYEVFSTDQIEARALLTPAFMERFVALSSRSGFALPGALAEGNRLIVALPKGIGTGDLFEPPVYWKPAGGQALVTLEQDIRAVLAMADTIIALDFWAAGAATTRPPRP